MVSQLWAWSGQWKRQAVTAVSMVGQVRSEEGSSCHSCKTWPHKVIAGSKLSQLWGMIMLGQWRVQAFIDVGHGQVRLKERASGHSCSECSGQFIVRRQAVTRTCGNGKKKIRKRSTGNFYALC